MSLQTLLTVYTGSGQYLYDLVSYAVDY